MERILKPAKLEISPSDEACEKSWKHWRVTFENYVSQYMRQYNTKDAADNVVPATDVPDKVKLSALICNISPALYEIMQGSPSFAEAITVLEDTFSLS